MDQNMSDAKLEIMKMIWANKRAICFTFMIDGLTVKDKAWQKSTIIMLLSRLMSKDYLSAKKIGRRNKYTPFVFKTDYQADQTKILLNKIYKESANDFIFNLIQSNLLADNKYKELKKWLEGGKQNGE